ncbi:MAG: aldo/keto reductase [Chloroflexota bacterium]
MNNQLDQVFRPIGIGTAPIGWDINPITEAQAIETVHAALAHDVRFFDTAPFYGMPGERTSETRLGLALASSGASRDSYTLATKVGLEIDVSGNIIRNMTPDGVKRSLETSMSLLYTDHIEIVHLHEPEAQGLGEMAAVYQVLDEYKRQGIIQAIGAGMNDWSIIPKLWTIGEFQCFLVAGRYTLLEQGAAGIYDECHARGTRIVAAGIFNSGILATGASDTARYNYHYAPDDVIAKVQRIDSICQTHNVPMLDAALQFPHRHPAVATTIFGAASPEEIATNVRALATSIDDDFWSAVTA